MTEDRALPLNSYPLMCTSDAEEMRASFAHIYGRPGMEFVGRDRALRAVVNHCGLEHIEINYGSYGTELALRFPESRFVSQIFPIRGSAEARVGGQSVTIDTERSVVVSGGAALNISNNADYERLILCIDSKALAQRLTALTGVTVPLRMHHTQDLRAQPARLLRANFMFLVNQLSLDAPMARIVLAEFEQNLMTAFLYANRHNYSHLLERDPPDAAPHDVRLAEAYIEANWDKPFNPDALAAETGVGLRSLFRRFRQSRGCSPIEFLRQVRLCRARETLESPGPAAAVADVAFACGFGSVARFSEDYLRRFGELPSVTLEHAKRAKPSLH
ncbi:MAG: AraC family transcriptional regulator [Pseudolabrys sp.]